MMFEQKRQQYLLNTNSVGGGGGVLDLVQKEVLFCILDINILVHV